MLRPLVPKESSAAPAAAASPATGTVMEARTAPMALMNPSHAPHWSGHAAQISSAVMMAGVLPYLGSVMETMTVVT